MKEKKNSTPGLKIGIVGLGLIGGSFGRALLKKTPHQVFGCDIGERIVGAAKLVGAVSGELTDERVPELDILLFAVNPRVTAKLLKEYVPRLKAGCIVTDAGGLKRSVAAAMKKLTKKYPEVQFIGAHPMAGKEFSGLAHSSAALFEGASALLVPINASLPAVDSLKKLFTALGFKSCKVTTAADHDRMIAYTSQLCHVISSCYCLNPLAAAHDGFSAGSFRDLTRVARLSPQMWTELFCDNAENLSAVLDDFLQELTGLKKAIEAQNEESVYQILASATAKKEEIDKAGRLANRSDVR